MKVPFTTQPPLLSLECGQTCSGAKYGSFNHDEEVLL